MFLGTGHNVVSIFYFTRPDLLAPLAASMAIPLALLTPIAVPAQGVALLGVFLIAGVCWMLFGALLVWLARRPPVPHDRPLLTFVLVHQVSLLVLMVVFLHFHWFAGLALREPWSE